MRSRFGVGNSRYHYLEREEFVDTVYMGAFRSEVLDEVGAYDGELARNQDDELNYRIRAAGYGVLLSPQLVSIYSPPRSLKTLWRRQFYPYGYWKVRVLEKHPRSLQPRHLAPPALVLLLAISVTAAVARRKKVYLAPLGIYCAATFTAAGWASRSRLPLTPLVATVFVFMHLGYGIGFIHALARSRLRAWLRRGRASSSRQ
jgi:hypothetical protein